MTNLLALQNIGGGSDLVPLLSNAFPALPLEVVAAGVAATNAVFIVALMALGATVALRMARSWIGWQPQLAASNAPAARKHDSPRGAKPRHADAGRRDTTPWHAAARSRVVNPLERAKSDDETRRMRIRDRFIHVRFDGALQGRADFANAGKVIKAARLYFEDGRGDRADELLALAAHHHPEEKGYWLARLEIRFLLGDAPRFVEVAEAFVKLHPAAAEWDTVRRLGARLVPGIALFSGVEPLAEDHYGPWPDMPNWIQGSWDLTAEVTACEFHQRMGLRIEQRRLDHAALAQEAAS